MKGWYIRGMNTVRMLQASNLTVVILLNLSFDGNMGENYEV